METVQSMKRYLTFVTGLFECIGFAGVIFGWASLVFILKKENYFSDLCIPLSNTSSHSTENGTLSCDLQDERFALIFTVGSFVNNFVTLPCGFLFDHVGTMWTRFLSIFMYTMANLMIAFSNAEIAIMLFPAICFLAIGGILFLVTNIQVGNLFGRRRSTVITLYNGAFDSSSAIFLIIKVLYEAGLSLRSMFLFISCMSALHIARTYLLLPRSHIPYPLPVGYTYGLQCLQPDIPSPPPEEEAISREPLQGENRPEGEKSDRSDETQGVAAKVDGGSGHALNGPIDSEENKKDIPSFRSCVVSKLFLTHLVWLSVMQLRHYLFIGTLNPMLTLLAKGDAETISKYTNSFALTQLFGVFCAPWNGLIMDRHKHKASSLTPSSGSAASQRLADLRSSVLSLGITSTQCVLFSICASIPILPVQYLTFVLQVINRSFLYGGHTAFTAIGYPPCHFGKIYGMLMSLSAIVSLFQYVCFALVKGPLQNNPLYVNISFIVLTILTYIHPLNVLLHCQRGTEQREDAKPPLAQVPVLGEKGSQPRETDI